MASLQAVKRIIKRVIRKVTGRGSSSRSTYVPYGSRDKQHQLEFRKNEEAILGGWVPERLATFAALVPGEAILDIGSADGTLSLALGRTKRQVIGLELEKYRHDTAQRVRDHWVSRGEPVAHVRFECGDVTRATEFLGESDCVVLSRTLYHLRDKADWLFEQIQNTPSVTYIALLGNQDKERRWKDGSGIQGLDHYYLGLSSLEGMVDIVTRHGFEVTTAIPTEGLSDPVVVAKRVHS